jgi:hypothetical protein
VRASLPAAGRGEGKGELCSELLYGTVSNRSLRTPNFLLRRGTSDIFWWSECRNLFRKTMAQREYLFYYRQQDHERERDTMPTSGMGSHLNIGTALKII